MNPRNFPYSNRSKVLIIDDEVDLCLLMRQYLLRKNYEVFISHTAAEGISRAEDLQPEIITACRNLPDGSYKLERRLREVAPYAKIHMYGSYC